jgi:hypothetical protein
VKKTLSPVVEELIAAIKRGDVAALDALRCIYGIPVASPVIKLQYRDRWPTYEEAIAHQRVSHGDIWRCLWMVRDWHNGRWTNPAVEDLNPYPGDKQVYPQFASERQDHTVPLSEFKGRVSCAPIDWDGNAVEWPT